MALHRRTKLWILRDARDEALYIFLSRSLRDPVVQDTIDQIHASTRAHLGRIKHLVLKKKNRCNDSITLEIAKGTGIERGKRFVRLREV